MINNIKNKYKCQKNMFKSMIKERYINLKINNKLLINY